MLPFLSRSMQRVDEVHGGFLLDASPGVEVPVDRPALGVEAEVPAAPVLAAHDPPGRAADVLLEPVLEGAHSLRRVVAATLARVVPRSPRSACRSGSGRCRVGLQAGRRDGAQEQAQEDRQCEAQHPPGAQTFHVFCFGRPAQSLKKDGPSEPPIDSI